MKISIKNNYFKKYIFFPARISDFHQVALGFLIRILSYNPKYKDVFRDVGVLEVLTNCLKQYADGLKEKYDGKWTMHTELSIRF